MKTKTIIMVALIAFTFSCALMRESGKKEEPFEGEPQQEEVLSEPSAQEEESTPEPVITSPEMVSVIGSVVNIRSGPSTKNKVITKVKKGDELELLGENDSWCNVRLSSGAEGWIYKKFVR